jgi:ATPase subunit of ABC transporter with duplicated ATPase domains
MSGFVLLFKKEIMITLQNISYIHSDREWLFDNVNLSIRSKEKAALTGNNGVGKSTLLKIIAGEISPSAGTVTVSSKPCYVPQIVGQFDHLTVSQALGIADKLNALSAILSGNMTETNWSILNDDWTIEERCKEALSSWQLAGLNLNEKLGKLSGGQKTKVFLAGLQIHRSEIALLDEPTNHMDLTGRTRLYRFVRETSCTLIVVSHDRTLLNQLNKICELNRHGIKVYGGNYDFYKEQKTLENESLISDLEEKQKSLRKAKEIERETLERKQRQNARGKNQQKKEGTPKAMIDKMKNDSENSAAHLKGVHSGKINAIAQELSDLRKEIPCRDKIKFGFDSPALHKGKILVEAKGINYTYGKKQIWRKNLDFQIVSGERIVIKGDNGSGKTTLLRLILGTVEPTCGTLFRAINSSIYIDQDYSILDVNMAVYEQAQAFNHSMLQEHEIKIRLDRFLFPKECWEKSCAVLSGGEKMRLLLCCLTITSQSPDIIVLDEPTNNLDIQNMEILTNSINEYQGTLIVVSHDSCFVKQINVERQIDLETLPTG